MFQKIYSLTNVREVNLWNLFRPQRFKNYFRTEVRRDGLQTHALFILVLISLCILYSVAKDLT